MLLEHSSGFFVEPRWFLIERTFASRTLLGVFVELRRSYIQGQKKASLNMFSEYSPCSANVASDWLRAKSSTVDEEEIKITMDDGVDTSLASDGTDLFVDLWEA